MKQYAYIAIFFIITCANADEGTEPALFPLDIDKIKKLIVTDTGIKAVAGKKLNIDCKNFILSQSDVEEYFKLAKKIYKSDYRNMLDWSPCYVRGKILLVNGITGKWSIHQYRGGVVNFSNSKTIYMFCPTCTAKTFDNPEYLLDKKHNN